MKRPQGKKQRIDASRISRNDLEYVKQLRSEKELVFLESVVRDADSWWHRYTLTHPGAEREAVFKMILDRREELLRTTNKRVQTAGYRARLLRQTSRRVLPVHSAGIMVPPQPGGSILEAGGAPTSGVAYAGLYHRYDWAPPSHPNDTNWNCYFWQNAGPGAAGASFYAYYYSHARYGDSVASMDILQISFPCFPHDGYLDYMTKAIVAIPCGVYVNGDAHLRVDFMVNDENAILFPPLSRYDEYDLYFADKTSNSYQWGEVLISGRIPVKAVPPGGLGHNNLYIGASIYASGRHDDTARTIGAGYFEFRVPDFLQETFQRFSGVVYWYAPA